MGKTFQKAAFGACLPVIVILFMAGFPPVGFPNAYTEEVSDTVETACLGDTDCDGLPDAREDSNGNGQFDADLGETDPKNPDSDGDGLTDGEERLHTGRIEVLLSEPNAYFNDIDRLNPLKSDSDMDCIPDGVEAGVSKDSIVSLLSRIRRMPRYDFSPRCLRILEDNRIMTFGNAVPTDGGASAGTLNTAMFFDSDPASFTDPTSDDTDGDGRIDGMEDVNFSGARDREISISPDEVTRLSDEIVWTETDPLNPDSDRDGRTDGEEGDRDGDGVIGENESDPLSRDTDHDGVSDGDEERLGTNVNECDTDGDGLSDGVELGRIQPLVIDSCHGLQPAGTNYRKPGGMSPINPDSDGDGLRDGLEDKNGNGWQDPEDSDPSVADTDRDGMDDGQEAGLDFDGDGNQDFDYRLIDSGRECRPPEDASDLDCDSVPNARDDDSDNDGCSDAMEGAWADTNTNGIPDVFDNKAKVCPEEAAPSSGAGGVVEKEGDKTPKQFLPNDGTDGTACSFLPEDVFRPARPCLDFAICLVMISALHALRRVIVRRKP